MPSNVVKLADYRNKRKVPEEDDLSVRISRITSSIWRINQLIKDLKGESDATRDEGSKR